MRCKRCVCGARNIRKYLVGLLDPNKGLRLSVGSLNVCHDRFLELRYAAMRAAFNRTLFEKTEPASLALYRSKQAELSVDQFAPLDTIIARIFMQRISFPGD